MLDLASARRRLASVDLRIRCARLVRVDGQGVLEAAGGSIPVGSLCRLWCGSREVLAEVVGMREGRILVLPYAYTAELGCDTVVEPLGTSLRVPVTESLVGRVLDACARPLDGGPPLDAAERLPWDRDPPAPFERREIDQRLAFGVRVLDACLTCGKGQRIGIFSNAGVGKSTLLGMIARGTEADVNVIALVGERGREVMSFVERVLGKEGLSRSVVIVSTSAEPPLARVRAAFTAVTIAEWFRDRGAHVLFMMDSITRLAQARREMGLAVGEQPTARGYTPSVFSLLPRLIERAGTSAAGTITALYTVLVEGEELEDPVCEAVKSLLDGHVFLSRKHASRGRYPAVDLPSSLSRLMPLLVDREHLEAAMRVREAMALLDEAEELLRVGVYEKGRDPRMDGILELGPVLREFVCQDEHERCPWSRTCRELFMLDEALRELEPGGRGEKGD